MLSKLFSSNRKPTVADFIAQDCDNQKAYIYQLRKRNKELELQLAAALEMCEMSKQNLLSPTLS